MWVCEIQQSVAVYTIVLYSVCVKAGLIFQALFILSGEKWAVSECILSPPTVPTVNNEKEHL